MTAIPVTVPFDVLNVLIVFEVTMDVGEPLSTVMPVRTPADEKFVIVLDVAVAAAPPLKPCNRRPVKLPPAPPTQLLQMLFWMTLGAASWLFTQNPLVVPAKVTFEKLLLLCVTVAVAALPPVLTKPLTVPPLPVLLNVPTIALFVTVWVPEAGSDAWTRRRKTDPDVFTLMLVKVLSLMVCERELPPATLIPSFSLLVAVA
jgi:hypothetical protein